MALETWLNKIKKTISHMGLTSLPKMKPSSSSPLLIKKTKVGVLAFEIAGIMSKILHLWNSLSEKNIIRLRNDSTCLEGVRKIVSNDEAFLLDLACAEMVENLSLIAKAVSRFSKKCEDSNLRSFDRLFEEFSNTGRVRNTNNWVLSLKEMEIKIKKLDDYVSLTSTLHREMDELLVLENGYKKLLFVEKDKVRFSITDEKIIEQQQKIMFQRQQVKYLKEKSLWCKSFDTVTSLLGRCIFTSLSKLKHVFGINQRYPVSLSRSLSASAVIYPSDHQSSYNFVSGPLMKISPHEQRGFFESYAKILEPPSGTLGAAAFALHYANLVIVLDKMIRSPQLIGEDARNHIYSMLPNSLRLCLKSRLKKVRFSGGDPILAGEWKAALQKIMGWLAPLAQNMIKWQSERSFEQQNLMPKTNVLLLQTLYFANKVKTEAAITELLVGLNYIWRYEREMNALALLECGNFNGFLKS